MTAAVRTITIIGGGKMGEAILKGWLSSADPITAGFTADAITVVNPGEDRRAFLAERYGVTCVESATQAQPADLVVLAVKPQVMPQVLADIAQHPSYQGDTLFVSIAAGLATKKLESWLPKGARLVRVMPNTPLMVAQGATAVTAGSLCTNEDVDLVYGLFGCLGVAVVVDESQMDAVCAVSGSGPAYVCAMVEALRDAGAECGLPVDLAEKLAAQTVLGTMQMLRETGQTPEQARKAVCSPGGTTLAALDAMHAAGFNDVFSAGVHAADRRSKELGA